MTTSAVRRTWSATKMRASRRSSTLPYAIERVLAEAAKREVRIVRTIETHTHADHLSGHGRLALEHGLPISIHPAAEAAYEHDPLDDGAEVVLGDVVLRAIHTPGHRPGAHLPRRDRPLAGG